MLSYDIFCFFFKKNYLWMSRKQCSWGMEKLATPKTKSFESWSVRSLVWLDLRASSELGNRSRNKYLYLDLYNKPLCCKVIIISLFMLNLRITSFAPAFLWLPFLLLQKPQDSLLNCNHQVLHFSIGSEFILSILL